MIDFINKHLPNLKIKTSSLQPIYVDDVLIDNHLVNFNNELLDNLKDYYFSKNSLNIIQYSLLFTEPKGKYSHQDYIFTLTNKINKCSIVVSVSKQNNFATIEFYLNLEKNKIKDNTKMKGNIFVMSNFINNGVGLQLLDILYQYLENEHFDQNNPFCEIFVH